MLEDIDIQSGDLKLSHNITSYKECYSLCFDNPECAAFTFHTTDMWCILRDSNTAEPIELSNRTSAYMSCYDGTGICYFLY